MTDKLEVVNCVISGKRKRNEINYRRDVNKKNKLKALRITQQWATQAFHQKDNSSSTHDYHIYTDGSVSEVRSIDKTNGGNTREEEKERSPGFEIIGESSKGNMESIRKGVFASAGPSASYERDCGEEKKEVENTTDNECADGQTSAIVDVFERELKKMCEKK
ncbi:hypothetical protein ANN_27301 [Periplaneta americana]|uniref:Uncharacterized protein n=1 Tax=Periplaneta americana TaxID=6978 RepID=A0ABQ8RXW4_PERAM|nr:hypothetical protein ANN_27301 [Periplaneta americana]